MSVWVAGATVAVGVYSASQANKAGDKAAGAQDRATEASVKLGEDQLDFQKEQYDEQLARYDEWKAIYGPIEENLADFYSNLSPATYAAAGLEYNQKEFQKAKQTTLETLAQRGIATSGLVASTEKNLNLANAENKAKIRQEAPFKVAEAKSGFLSQGKGGPTYGPQGTGVANAMQNLQQATVSGLQRTADMESDKSASLWGSAGNMFSTGLGYYANNRPPSANEGNVKSGEQ